MLDIFSSLLDRTPKEVVSTVSTMDMSFIQNIFAKKIKHASEITYNMYQTAFLFSLIAAGRGVVLAVGNPSKEYDTWIRKFKTMEQKCFAIQKDLAQLHQKVSLVESLQEEAKIHKFPSTLASWTTELEVTLNFLNQSPFLHKYTSHRFS